MMGAYKDDANKEKALFPFEVWEDVQRDEPASRWSILLKRRGHIYADVEEVLQYGLKKYGKRDSWQLVENGYERYGDAMMRHETQDGDDEESGLAHYKHSLCNMMFLAWFDLDRDKKEREYIYTRLLGVKHDA